MARIKGVDIPRNKHLVISLRYIYGIGRRKAQEICEKASLAPCKKVKDLTEGEVVLLNKIIEESYLVEGALKREVQSNIRRLGDLKCYRGIRHRKKLPVRGQRTSCNAKTCRKGLSY